MTYKKTALGALSGFEYIAIMAGETRNAGRSIIRSVLVAAPLIALMFILRTDSVMSLVPRDRIDLVSPIPQALSVGFAGSGAVQLIASALILLLLLRHVGVVTTVCSTATPVLFVSAITIAFSLAGQIGVGVQEAFQLPENAAGILYAFTYLGPFGIPLFGAARLQRKPPVWLRIASASGFVMALLYSFDAIAVSDYRGGELADIRVEDHHGDPGRECHLSCRLLRRS